ncbi:MAG: 16S rRNA (cytosine(1402)-N(4))-methyltransferase RsmH [Vulcanibacillus sp.]
MFEHKTVLLHEAVEGLNIKPSGIYVDCTLGGAGHSALILSKLADGGKLISFDQDEEAIKAASQRLNDYGHKVILVKTNFVNIKEVLNDMEIFTVNGILFDLGVSSPQLDTGERGFSYNLDAPLDMRMDKSCDLNAMDIVNGWDEKELTRILFEYGEEKFARRIAGNILEYRKTKKIERTSQLVEIIKDSIPAAARRSGPHPAKKTFQAIRIAVNDELNTFEKALEDAITLLGPEGRISVVTFHSLEDKLCKHIFSKHALGCICPSDFPICACNRKPVLKIIAKKGILPTENEIIENPRSRSAKLRIAERI